MAFIIGFTLCANNIHGSKVYFDDPLPSKLVQYNIIIPVVCDDPVPIANSIDANTLCCDVR